MIGFTGVVWYPRGATRMSLELYAGPGPVPLGVASASWSAMAAQLAEASVVLAGAVTALQASWRGPAADMALASFANFGVWMGETTEHASRMSGTTGAGSAAYAASALVMPSPAEIAVTKAAMAATTVAAASTGAGLGAAMAANEAAEREMDIRATIAMEGYEAASTLLSAPVPFRPAPPIAIPELAQAGLASDLVTGIASKGTAVVTEFGAPAGGQVLAQGASASATASIATHAAGLDPTIAAHSSSGALAGKPVLTVGAGSAGGGSMAGAPMMGMAGGAGLGGGSRAAMPKLGTPVAGALGAPGGTGSNPAGAGSAAERAASSSRMGAGPMRGAGVAGGGAHSDDEHESPDYLRRFDRLEDGRTVVPAVIGGQR